jgi:hypothetical protein
MLAEGRQTGQEPIAWHRSISGAGRAETVPIESGLDVRRSTEKRGQLPSPGATGTPYFVILMERLRSVQRSIVRDDDGRRAIVDRHPSISLTEVSGKR